MNNQPPAVELVPDWREICLMLLWKMLPADQKAVEFILADREALFDAYAPGVPVLVLRPLESGQGMTVSLMSQPEAQAMADAEGARFQAPAPPMPAGTGTLQ